MTSPQRLFDCLEYLMDQGNKPDLLSAKENGDWRKYSTHEVKSIVDQLSAGLLQAGIGYGDGSPESRDKIAVLSKNRPEWILVDLAVQRSGAVLTPFYPTIHINELEYTLNDSQVKLIFVNSADDLEKVESIKDRVPSLTEIYTFEKVENDNTEQGILNFVNSHPTDMLAMIAHKHSFLARLFRDIHTPSVSFQVHLPLLVLKN
ncbi:MAG: hypothetical protein EOO01_03495 [Chitinophagaceae bacterium]|nr:MAG: hypothetical protein EOO01_03495 [Chitinophagaceae bacterium]